MNEILRAYLGRVVEEGLASVRAAYPEGDPRRAGAVEGFELAAAADGLDALEEIVAARNRREHRMKRGFHPAVDARVAADLAAAGACPQPPPIAVGEDDYLRHRYATLQVEFVLGRLRAMSYLTS